MDTFNLKPVNGQGSFYGKAVVLDREENTILHSYNTEVAWYDKETEKMTIKGWFSATTARHINSYIALYGFDKLSKAEMINLGTGK